MKFKVLMEDLKKALSLLGGIPNKKDINKENILQFEKVSETEVRINAKNEIINASVMLPVINMEGEWPKTIEENLEFEFFDVDATMFLGIMRALTAAKEEMIEFSLNEKELLFKGNKKRRKFKMPIMIGDKIIREVFETDKLPLNASLFYKHITKVLPIAADNNPRMEICGVLIDLYNKGVNFVTTDTTKLAVSNIPFLEEEIKPQQLIVPKKSVPLIKKAIELLGESTTIVVSDVAIGVVSEKGELYSKLINGKYPAYKKIIPPNFDAIVRVNKLLLIEILKEMSYIAEYVKFDLQNNGKVIVSSYNEGDNIGPDAEMEIDANFEGTGEGKDIVVSLRNIIPFVQNIESEEAIIGFNYESLPFKISGNPEEKFMQITMPLSVSV